MDPGPFLCEAPRLILANTVSDVILPAPAPEYRRRLEAATPRKIWIARPGDVLLTPRPVPASLRTYAAARLGTAPGAVTCLTPAAAASPYLPENVLADDALLERLRPLTAERPGIGLHPFVLDRGALALARALDVPLCFYAPGDPDDPRWHRVTEMIYRLNRKSAFRRLCGGLGLPVAPGNGAGSGPEVLAAVAEVLRRFDAAIVKLDRGSHGAETVIVRRDEGPAAPAVRAIADGPATAPRVVEALWPNRWEPAVEMAVLDDGPVLLYECDNRMVDGAWDGLTIPPLDAPEGAMAGFRDAGARIGAVLHDGGYRGFFGVEGLAGPGGEWILTEMNLRMTGGTHLHAILARLVGPDYRRRAWAIVGHVTRPAGAPFEALVDRLGGAGLNFDPERREGALVTVDSRDVDGRIRYVACAPAASRALEIDATARALLREP